MFFYALCHGEIPLIISEANDAALLLRITAGDRSGLALLYDRYGSTLFALARRITSQGELAADIVQEVFLELWVHPLAYQAQQGTLRSWLILNARSRSLQATPNAPPRPGKRRPRLVSVAPHDESPMGRERLDVRLALEALPYEQRDVLEMAYFHGLTEQQIAKKLSVSRQTVKLRFAAVHQRLRNHLHDPGRSV